MIDVAMGIDAGGTSTRAVVVRADGRCAAVARRSGGNPTSRGVVEGLRAITQAAQAAVADAVATLGAPVRVRTCLLAMAGEPALIDIPALAGQLSLETSAVRIVGDVEAMYFSGATEPVGTAVVVGTGSVAARFEAGEFTGAVGGAGWLLGDDGSGFWIGRRVVRTVVAQLSGLAEPTAMTPAVLAAGPDEGRAEQRRILGHGIELDRLIRRTYAAPPVHLADLAPIAFRFAATDAGAAAIVARAGEHIAALIDRFDDAGPLVVGGSVMIQGFLQHLQHAPALAKALQERQVRKVDSGLAGAGYLALRGWGSADRAAHDRILATLPATG